MAKAKKSTAKARTARTAGDETETVSVTLRGSYGYTDPATRQRRFYGPGQEVEVPATLAKALGLQPRPVSRKGRNARTAAKTDTTERTSPNGAENTADADTGNTSPDADANTDTSGTDS